MSVSKTSLVKHALSRILDLRMRNIGLVNPACESAREVTARLGAVQAQDFAAAKWALGMRIPGATNATIEQEYNDGRILRTHVMRPTWHFVLPEDAGWMLGLTSPRVKAIMGSYNRKLGFDDAFFAKTGKAIVRALRGNHYLTRKEIKSLLESMGIETDVQRLAHIVSWAELDGLITSGPMRGKQFTYALFEERVKTQHTLSKGEALASLALKYFTGHGPAQLADFAWWSGLGMKDARDALASVESKLEKIITGEKVYWYGPGTDDIRVSRPSAFLLSIFDEYTIAYKDRSDLSDERDIERMIKMGNALTSVIILDFKVAGTWKRNIAKKRLEISLSPFRDLSPKEMEAIDAEVARYGNFLGLEVSLVKGT